MDSTLIVIPARFSSTRLPAKMLAEIRGKPMIQWVYEQARKSQYGSDAIVATDDERIFDRVLGFGGKAIMTPTHIQSGTDRVAYVADQVFADIYVNLQGDEPLMDPQAIDRAVDFVISRKFDFSTVMTPLKNREELNDPSVVKVITDTQNRAIYFSRLPIPYSRGELPQGGQSFFCKRHVGLYVYRREILAKFRSLSPSFLEKAEVLEQLRALENGISIGVAEAYFTSIGVDTLEDLEKVRKVLV